MFVSPLTRITPAHDHVVPNDLQTVVTAVLARTHFPTGPAPAGQLAVERSDHSAFLLNP